MLIVGLTGGVASGKSVVSRFLKEEGAYLLDADQIARELVQPQQPAWSEIIRVFGKEILQDDGSIHRKKLADRIFADPNQRESLNQILHPLIKEEMDRRTKEIGQKDPEAIIVIDAPLLVETGLQGEMEKLIVVTSTQAQQVKRMKERDGRDVEEALRIISSQMPLEEKVRFADFVIQNQGSLRETKKKTKAVFQKLKEIAIKKKNIPAA